MLFLVWLKGVALASARLAVLFLSVQPFGGIPLSGMGRVVVVLGLAVGVSPMAKMGGVPSFGSPDAFAEALLRELVVGGVFAAGLSAAFAAFHFGGRLLEMQIGFGLSSIVDIATRSSTPLLSSLMSMAAAVCFFAMDGHLALLRLVHLSFEVFPVGQGLNSLAPASLIAQFATCFVFGFMVVSPVVLCLFLVDIGLAFASRSMPQMNVFVMSMAIKSGVGMAVLSVSLRHSGSVVSRVFESTFQFFENWLL